MAAMRCDCGARFTTDTDETAEFKLRWHMENTHGIPMMAEVSCRICKRPFIASSLHAAEEARATHEYERHGVREQPASAYLPLTARDREFLKGMRISTD